MASRRRTRTRVVAVAAGLALAVTSCGGSDSDDQDPAPTTAPTTLADGMTAPGTDLTIGDRAKVELRINEKKSSVVTITVTSVTPGKLSALEDFNLDDKTKKSSLYYVKLTARNVGDGDLSGRPLTLYGQVSDTLVVPPVTFGTTFERCPGGTLPKGFTKGKRAKICLTMLAPKKGKLRGVQFRPADNGDPITWSRS